MSVFNLHQATERAYNAIILVHSGYKSKTHNLYKLKRYAKRFSEELDSVFPYSNETEKHLFDLLKRAYVDAHYKENYQITEEELQILLECIQALLTITEKLCKEKIASFDAEGKSPT